MIVSAMIAMWIAGAVVPERSLYLEASPMAAKIRPLLAEELGVRAFAERRADARFVLAVRGGERELVLVLRNSRGEAVLARKIAITEGARPALRLAVVAIEEAIEAELALRAQLAAKVPGTARGAKVPVATATVAAARVPALAKLAGGPARSAGNSAVASTGSSAGGVAEPQSGDSDAIRASALASLAQPQRGPARSAGNSGVASTGSSAGGVVEQQSSDSEATRASARGDSVVRSDESTGDSRDASTRTSASAGERAVDSLDASRRSSERAGEPALDSLDASRRSSEGAGEPALDSLDASRRSSERAGERAVDSLDASTRTSASAGERPVDSLAASTRTSASAGERPVDSLAASDSARSDSPSRSENLSSAARASDSGDAEAARSGEMSAIRSRAVDTGEAGASSRRLSVLMRGGIIAGTHPVQPVLSIGATHELGPLELGILGSGIGFLGISAARVDGREGIAGTWQVMEVAAVVSWSPWRAGDIAMGGELAVGAALQRLEAESVAFEGPGVRNDESNVPLTLRAGVLASWRATRNLRLEAIAGAHYRSKALKAELPAGFPNGGAELDTTHLSAHLTLGARWSVF